MRRALLTLITALIVLGTHPFLAESASVDAGREWFMATPCPFETDSGREVRCGILLVPEDRAQRHTLFLRLPVAVFSAIEPANGKAPILYLDGGPGTLENRFDPDWIDYWRGWLDYETWTHDRDFIVPTQRGATYDSSALACSHLQNPAIFAGVSALPGLNTDWRRNASAAVRACKKRYDVRGHNLGTYTTDQIADDLSALMPLLGYDRWSLFGVSYGTRLGLTMMRRHGEPITSAIFDSLTPPEVLPDIDYLSQFNRSLQAMFDACADDEDCGEAFPNLEAAFENVLQYLEATPLEVRVSNNGNGGPGYWRVDVEAFLDVLFATLYWKSLIADLPRVIYRAGEGEFSDLKTLVVDYVGEQADTFADGMFLAVECREVYPGQIARAKRMANLDAGRRALMLRKWASDGWLAHTCHELGVPFAEPDFYKRVVSDIPTLLFAGHFDPVTPPAFAERAARSLSQSYFFEFGDAAHSVLEFDACATEIVDEFLDDPEHRPVAWCFDSSAKIDFNLN